MKRTAGIVMSVIMTAAALGSVMSVSASEALPKDAVSVIAENEIGIAEASQLALKDAGLTEDQVEFSKKVNEFSDGRFKYDIHFLVRGETKYDYELDALTGDILERDQEPWEADDDMEYQGLQSAGQMYFDTETDDVRAVLEEAFQTAVMDAGADETQIITYEYGVGYDEGNVILEAGFMIPGSMKYDYDVVLKSNQIDDRDQEAWEADDDQEYANLLAAPADTAAVAASAPAAALENTGEPDYKAIALQDAGFSEADVSMIKFEMDFDDGIELYEVDFYGPDGMKYEYDIKAVDGTILEKDVEFDD